jgi:hypothetical protein
MANILKTTLVENGYNKNCPESKVNITLDTDITPSEINQYLPNNNSRYDTKEVKSMISGSMAKIICPSFMYIAVFNAELGNVTTTKTTFKDGSWSVIGKSVYMTV